MSLNEGVWYRADLSRSVFDVERLEDEIGLLIRRLHPERVDDEAWSELVEDMATALSVSTNLPWAIHEAAANLGIDERAVSIVYGAAVVKAGLQLLVDSPGSGGNA